MQPDIHGFTSVLRHLAASSIRQAARQIELRRSDPADDVRWWEATLAVDELLARHRRTRQAAAASRAAGDAVAAAAEDHGLSPEDPDVRVVARRARQVARAVVAGPAASRHLQYLLAGWWRMVSVSAPSSGGASPVA